MTAPIHGSETTPNTAAVIARACAPRSPARSYRPRCARSPQTRPRVRRGVSVGALLGRDDLRARTTARATPRSCIGRNARGRARGLGARIPQTPRGGSAPAPASLFLGSRPSAAVEKRAGCQLGTLCIDSGRFRCQPATISGQRCPPPATPHSSGPRCVERSSACKSISRRVECRGSACVPACPRAHEPTACR